MKCSTCINYVSQPLKDSPCHGCVHRHRRLGGTNHYRFDYKIIAGVFILLAIATLMLKFYVDFIYYLMGGL